MDSASSRTESELIAAWKDLDRKDLLARYAVAKEIAAFASGLPYGYKSRFADQLGVCRYTLARICQISKCYSERHISKLADAGWDWSHTLDAMSTPDQARWPAGGLPPALSAKMHEISQRPAAEREKRASRGAKSARSNRIKSAENLPAPDLLSLALAKMSPAQVCNALDTYLRDSCKPARADAIRKGMAVVVAQVPRIVRAAA